MSSSDKIDVADAVGKLNALLERAAQDEEVVDYLYSWTDRAEKFEPADREALAKSCIAGFERYPAVDWLGNPGPLIHFIDEAIPTLDATLELAIESLKRQPSFYVIYIVRRALNTVERDAPPTLLQLCQEAEATLQSVAESSDVDEQLRVAAREFLD